MTRSTRTRVPVKSPYTERLQDVLGPEFETVVRRGVSELFAEIGLAVAEAIMIGEVDSLCGAKHARKEAGQPVRWGQQQGVIQARGTKECVSKPRVRTADGSKEVELKTYRAFNRASVLSDRTMALIGSGVSARQYVNTVQKDLRKHGVSRSAVSRRVIESTQQSLEKFQARKWHGHKFVAILIDGVRVGKVMVVAAVGVDKAGRKHVLGWNPGSTESEVVCRDLIRRLIESGLSTQRDYLFVVDGSKALSAAVKLTFGDHASIQRCQEHKIRDVEGYLPVKDRTRFREKLQAAYNQTTYQQAGKKLELVRQQLLVISLPAAGSLVEGLENTLTLHRLGISGGVRESLRTTNIIESTFARLRQHTRNVTNWTEHGQVERWLAFGLLKAEAGYRQLPGFRQLAKLERKLVAVQTALQTSKG